MDTEDSQSTVGPADEMAGRHSRRPAGPRNQPADPARLGPTGHGAAGRFPEAPVDRRNGPLTHVGSVSLRPVLVAGANPVRGG